MIELQQVKNELAVCIADELDSIGRDALVLYPPQANPVPAPDGLAGARMDGSASWVKWNRLAPIRQADRIYYERR